MIRVSDAQPETGGKRLTWTALVTLSMAVLVAPWASADAQTPSLTLDRLYSLPNLIGTAPKGFAWSQDGRYLAFLWNDQGRNFHDVWVLDVDDPLLAAERLTRMPRDMYDRAAQDDPLEQALVRERVERDRGVTSVAWHPNGRDVLIGFRGDLWVTTDGSEPRRLVTTEAVESQPAYSPTGEALAFLREGDVWLVRVNADENRGTALEPRRLTNVAGPAVRVASFQWSPDGTRIAVLDVDQSGVTRRGIPDYLTDETSMLEVGRAYPGEEPARQRVGIVDVEAARMEWVGLDEGPWRPESPWLILGYAWSPDGQELAIDTSDLYAKDRRIYVSGAAVSTAAGRTSRLVVREQDPLNETFYYWRIAWSTDSQRLYFLSDRDEDYHVYAVDLASRPEAPPEPLKLTQGAWAVAALHPVDGGLVVVGNHGSPEERHLFRVSDTGGEAVRLSHRLGTHAPTLSPDGRHAAVAFSSDGTPPELLLNVLDHSGTPPRADALRASEHRVTESPVPEFHSYDWVQPRYVTFRSHIDGTTLHGRLTLPRDFDPTRTYPAILGSVYTDAVRNQWGGRTAHPTWGLDQYLAQEGYVLLNIDMRGSWGRGRDHRRAIRLDYGGVDIEDLESGVRFLAEQDYVDMDRVGLWGSSYGGLMTIMSLFRKPGLYAAGVAGAPATSVWHALTGQMAVMMAPEDQPDEYADSSPFMHAHGLQDPLMIIHGMRDQVVLFKDTITLVQRLLMLGKDVDLVTLPNSGHGWDNEGLAQTRFAFKKLVEHFDRHLKDGSQ